MPDSRASRKSYFIIIYLFWGAGGNTSSMFLFLFWLQNLGPQSGCIVICPCYRGTEKWLGRSAQRVGSAEKVGPTSGSRGVGSTRPCAGLSPSGSLGCPVSQTLSPARPTEPLLLGQRQLVIEFSLCARGCTPAYTCHLISPILQMRRLRHAWSHNAGKRQSKKSNLPLWDLGFKRDAIRFAFSEAPSASRLGVRDTVDGGGQLGGWGPGRPLPTLESPEALRKCQGLISTAARGRRLISTRSGSGYINS